MSAREVEPPIDAAAYARLVEMTGGELEFVDELVDTYLRDAAAQVGQLRSAAAVGDADVLGRAAHSLKSGSLTIGALDVGERARSLEEAARAGAVPDAAKRVADIAAAFDEAELALRSDRAARPG